MSELHDQHHDTLHELSDRLPQPEVKYSPAPPQPPLNDQLLTAFRLKPGTPHDIGLFIVSEGAIGACPAWYNQYSERLDMALTLNCPVWSVQNGYVVRTNYMTPDEGTWWFQIARTFNQVQQFLSELTDADKENIRAAAANAVQQAVQAVMAPLSGEAVEFLDDDQAVASQRRANALFEGRDAE